MSSLVLTGDTSGQVTVAAPAVAGTNTITLPASTGTAIISDASANIQFNSGYGSVATAYGCRAWVNFNGQGTIAIRASGNVSSITDNGVGDYTVNFTTAMTDANYTIGLTYASSTTAASKDVYYTVRSVLTMIAGSVRFLGGDFSNAAVSDAAYMGVSIFR
jgi:hypothetical protein